MKKFFVLTVFICLSYCAFSQIPLYRYYNRELKLHWYTVDFNRFGNGANGWALEGVACRMFPGPDQGRGIVAFNCFFNRQTWHHYYSTRREVLEPGFVLQGPEGYISLSQVNGTIPLFDFYNRIVRTHFYTTDRSEIGHGGFGGFEYSGIAGYVLPR